jgi:hypothetical protein
MPFTVVFQPDALDELMRLYLVAPTAASVEQAANRIDHVLSHYPEIAAPDANGKRQYTVPPLSVAYNYSPDDCLVSVVQVQLLTVGPDDPI